MSTVFMTGSHPRHAAMARAIAASGALTALVIEEREEHVPEPPDHLSPDLADLFRLHFDRRVEAEARFFGDDELPDVPVLRVERDELNGQRVASWLRSHDPDLLLSYGVHILSDETLAAAGAEAWNIHGGLSPWYRGAITHFWPSYLLQPQYTGMTLHETIAAVDAGAIVHQTAAPLVRGDGLHDLACRAVLSMADQIADVITRFHGDEPVEKRPQGTTGRIWRGADWRADHLRVIYEHYDDAIVDRYLDGYFEQSEPNLHVQG